MLINLLCHIKNKIGSYKFKKNNHMKLRYEYSYDNENKEIFIF